jgi:hypothetical protein
MVYKKHRKRFSVYLEGTLWSEICPLKMPTRQGIPSWPLFFFNTFFSTHIPCGYLLGITEKEKRKDYI